MFRLLTLLRNFLYFDQLEGKLFYIAIRLCRSLYFMHRRISESYQGLSLGRMVTVFEGIHVLMNSRIVSVAGFISSQRIYKVPTFCDN